jgi:hypothetical protein
MRENVDVPAASLFQCFGQSDKVVVAERAGWKFAVFVSGLSEGNHGWRPVSGQEHRAERVAENVANQT